jgi:hypothetical protein
MKIRKVVVVDYGWDDEVKSFSLKRQYVQVDGVIHQEAIDKLKAGVVGFNGTKYITKM